MDQTNALIGDRIASARLDLAAARQRLAACKTSEASRRLQAQAAAGQPIDPKDLALHNTACGEAHRSFDLVRQTLADLLLERLQAEADRTNAEIDELWWPTAVRSGLRLGHCRNCSSPADRARHNDCLQDGRLELEQADAGQASTNNGMVDDGDAGVGYEDVPTGPSSQFDGTATLRSDTASQVVLRTESRPEATAPGATAIRAATLLADMPIYYEGRGILDPSSTAGGSDAEFSSPRLTAEVTGPQTTVEGIAAIQAEMDEVMNSSVMNGIDNESTRAVH